MEPQNLVDQCHGAVRVYFGALHLRSSVFICGEFSALKCVPSRTNCGLKAQSLSGIAHQVHARALASNGTFAIICATTSGEAKVQSKQ